MWKLSWYSYNNIAKKLKKFWFTIFRQAKWSHEIWYNKDKNVYTTVPKNNKDMPEWTLSAILKQANISSDDFISK